MPAKRASKLSNRPSLERYQLIFNRIKNGQRATVRQLAADLGVSTKTIYRDLDYMRDRMQLPIAYNADNHAYEFTEDVQSLPAIEVTESELVALLVARRTLEHYRGTAYHAQLESAFAKLLVPLTDFTRFSPGALEISLPLGPGTRHEPLVHQKLAEALVGQFEVTFSYRKAHAQPTEKRRVRPYHLTCRQGSWYLVAFDVQRAGMRTFALSRISQVHQLAASFERPADFSIDDYYRHSFGVAHGEARYTIVLHADSFAAEYLRDRHLHDSQEITDLPDGGGVQIKLHLHDLVEVERLVLHWGGHVQALEPTELRDRVAAAARQLALKHPCD